MLLLHICAIFLYLFLIERVKCQEIDCSIPDGSVGVCTQIADCPSIQSLLSVTIRPLPSHIVEILNIHTSCGFDNDMPKICCLDDILTTTATKPPPTTTTVSPPPTTTPTPPPPPPPTTTTTTSPTTTTTTTTPTTTTIAAIQSQINQTEDQTSLPTSGPDSLLTIRGDLPNLNLLPLTTCGDIIERRISNGDTADLFQFPWMALLRYESDGNTESLCGGSLISDRYVLTAAHCVTGLQSTMRLVGVRLGEHDTTTDIDCQMDGSENICAPPVQDIPIEEVIFHPMFNRPKHCNDVAVIRLAIPANMTSESVRPICLPTTYEVQSTVLERVLVTGWGTTETQRPATVLLQALMPIVPNDICQKDFYKRSVQLTSGQMCAGGEVGIDACKGDSGGPLVYPATLDSLRMVQFGIVSAGVSLCSNTNNFPGIYARVGYYMHWILDQMRP